MDPILSITFSKSNSYATAFLFNSKSVTSYFMNHGYDVVVLNPLQTHEFKKKTIHKVKTDPVDTNKIAKVYYFINE